MNTPKGIFFFYQYKGTAPANRTRLKKFLLGLARREGRTIESLNIIFCNDEQLLQINRNFLNHNDYTDIITFDLSAGKQFPVTAEIYISTERVRENAKKFCTTIQRELHRVIFHGVLHLCGYGDKKPAEIKQMRTKEEEHLHRYFK